MTENTEEDIVSGEELPEEVTQEESLKKPAVVPAIVKPHNKFAQYNVQTRFGGGNKYGNASGKRMGRAAQRGR